MAGNNVEVHINGDEDVSAAAAKAAAAIDSLKDKKITVEVNVDDKKAKKALENIDKKVKEIGNDVGVFDLNTRKARDKLTYLHERAKALGDLETEIDVDTRKARDKLTYLHNRHKEIGDNKPEVDVDTSKARDKFSYLKSRFSDIFSDKPEVDINTKKARDKLSKLGSRLKEVTSTKQEIDLDADKARDKLSELNDFGKNLEKIKIKVDIDDAIDEIEDLSLILNNLRDKTINIDVDSGQALAQIAALDSALHGLDGRKKVELDVDVNDTDMMKWQSELDTLNRNKRRIQNNPYELTIPTEIEVDEDRIKELEKRIADKRNTIKVKTELDNSELEDAGIKDKKVKIDVEINGLERLQALRAVIASLEDKTININVNSDSRAIDKLTNSSNGIARPIVQAVRIKYDSADYSKLNRIMQQGIKDMNTRNNKRANDFLINNIDNAAALLADRMKAYKSIDKNNSLKFDNIAPQKLRVLVDDSEVKRYQQAIDALEKDKQFIGPEIEARKLGQLTKMRQELERLETLGKSSLTPQTGKNGLVDLGRQRAKLRKQISDFEKDFNNNPVQIAAEMAINERRIKDLTDKLASRQRQLGEPFKNINIDNNALKNAKKNLKDTDIKIKAILDRDNAIKDLKNQKAEIEKTPIKLRTESDRNSLRNIIKDLKNLENIKRQSASLDSRVADKNRYQGEIKSIKAVRTALNDANNLKLKDVRIKAQADTTAAAAKFDALTRPRESRVDIQVNESRIQRVTRLFNDIGNSATNSGRRISRAFDDDSNGLNRTFRNVANLSNGINRGIGSMTSRIPLVGSLFKGLAGLGDIAGGLTSKMAGLAGAGPKVSGALGGVASAVISAGSALIGLGIIGTVGTGLITAGAYAATAALGTVAGVVGAIGAAIGGGAIAGFAMLVKDAPEVQEAYSKLGTTIGDTMKRLAEPVKMPIVDAAPKLQAAFDQVSPSISRIASQTGNLITEIGDKLPAVAKEAGPALQKAFDFGESSLNTLMDNMPAITKSIGEFFGKMDGPGVRKAVDGAFGAIPGIIGKIGTGIEKASAGFNSLQEFMGSDRLDPMREGFEKFSQSLAATDWSSASSGITDAMNAFGNFAGSIDMQNISDGIGSISSAFANLTDVAASMNLDGIFAGLGKGFEGFTEVLPSIAKAFGVGGSALTEPFMKAYDSISSTLGNIFGADKPVNVEGPSIELNPNISVADQDQADIAKDILSNIDGKSFGSADAAERIISGLNNDISKLQVKPEVKGILDEGSIAENINSDNIGKILQSRIGDGAENAVKIPIQTAMDIETAAGKDGLNVQDSIKDQLSKLTGIAVEDLNIEVGIGTTFKVAQNADGSIGDLIKGTIDAAGNLSVEVVATANVVAQIAGITGLDGAALDSLLGGVFDGQTISQELAVQIKANMGLADASMSDFEAALEGQLAGINGQNYDVILNADGTVNITVKDAVVPEIPEVPPLPDLTMQQKAVVALQFDMKYTEFGALTEQLQSLGQQGGESIEITKEMQVNLEAVVGGGTTEEVQGKIKELISGLTGIAVEDLDITFDVNGKPQFNLLGNPAAEIADAVKSSAASAESAKTTVTPQIDVQPQVNMNGLEAGKGIAQGLQKQFGGAGSPIKVTPQVDVSGIAQSLGSVSVPPIKVLVQPDLTGFAAILGAIGGASVGVVKVLVQADLTGFAAIVGALNGSTIGTVKLLVVPDLSALGALGGIVLPAIRVPIIVDPPVIPQIAVPMIRGTITFDVVMPQIAVPNTTSTHTIMIVNPGLPSFPNTTSTHSIIMNVPAMPSFPNTSSTHTINVVVNGSTSVGGGGSARAGAMAAAISPLARGIAPMSMGSVTPMGASGMSGGGRGVSAIRQTGVAIANSFASGLASGVGAVERAAGQLAEAAGAIGPQVDKYLTANSPEYAAAKQIGSDVVNSISQGISNAQTQIATAMDGINAAVQVGSDGFQKIIAEEMVLPPMDQLVTKAQEIGDGIGAALMGDPSKLAGTMDGIGQAIGSKLDTVAGRVNGVMGQVNQTMRDQVPGFADAQDKAAEFGNGLATGVENARMQMNQQLSSMALPTIPTPQMALEGINAEVAKAKTAIEGGIRGLLVQTPAPVVPTPDLNPVMQALGQIPGVIPTINKVQSDADKAIQDINKIPAVVETKNQIEAAMPKLPKIPDTSSTHTIKVRVNGSTAGAGGSTSRSGAMSSALARGSVGGLAMGASGGALGGSEASSLYSIGESISLSVADGISAGIPSVISAGNALSSAAFDSIAGNFSNIAFENGKATALGYVDGIMSQYGIATTAGARLGNNVLAGAKFNGIFTNEVGKQVAEIMKFFGNGIGKIIFQAVGAIPYVGPLLQIAGILFGQFAQAAAYNSSPYAKGVSNYYYYHYETTNNSFDGGLIGDPESQARKVLDVLEQSPSTRRIRKVFSQ